MNQPNKTYGLASRGRVLKSHTVIDNWFIRFISHTWLNHVPFIKKWTSKHEATVIDQISIDGYDIVQPPNTILIDKDTVESLRIKPGDFGTTFGELSHPNRHDKI